MILSFFSFACTTKKDTIKQEVVAVNKPAVPTIKGGAIQDLMLLYQGGTHRLDYTEEELKPYVYRVKSQKHEWLFDGFLFIEFKDNRGYEYANGYGNKPANKAQWTWLTARNFEEGKGVTALNNLLQNLSKNGEVPKRMRSVVLTLPDPIIGNKTWGDVNGRNLDFDNIEDRIDACKWYVDYVIQKWKEQKYDQLYFKGFYWVAETQKDSWDILPEISKYIKSKGYEFYWVPYMYAEGAEKWKESGFDHAYQQPNYFFKLEHPYSLLTKAIDMGNTYNMGLEIEFDSNVSNPEFAKRYYDYINAFEEGDVWRKKPVAYYEGGGAWLEMSKGSSTLRKMYDDLSDIVVRRQNEFDNTLKN